MAPSQAIEAAEVAIGGDPLTPRLDRQCRQVGVGDKVALGPYRQAQPLEDLPVPSSGSDGDGVGLASQRDGEGQGLIDRCRGREDARVGDDPNEAAQNEIGDAYRLVSLGRRRQPGTIAVMVRSAFVECMDEDVDVNEDQESAPSIRSSKAALSSRSIPART